MNRRRFLKYAGATAAVVGASALGLNYVSQPSPSMTSPTTSTTLVPRRITTSVSLSTSTESVQLASLRGRLFFDYNGNGKQDTGEPAVAGALVQLKDDTGKVITETLTDSSGDYKLEDIRTGAYRLLIGVDQFSDKKLRFMCRSTEEFTAIPEGYSVLLDRSQSVSIGLMEGYETLPFLFKRSIDVLYFVDVGDVENPNDQTVRDWQGGTRTYKGHQGIDYIAPEGTPVTAAAPGIVIGAEDNWQTNADLREIGNRIVIDHLNGFKTAYNHLREIKVRAKPLDLNPRDFGDLQRMRRGEIIGTVGRTGQTPFSHLHFESLPRNYRYSGGGKGWVIDHYRDLHFGAHGRALFSNPLSLWTKDNDPQFPATEPS